MELKSADSTLLILVAPESPTDALLFAAVSGTCKNGLSSHESDNDAPAAQQEAAEALSLWRQAAIAMITDEPSRNHTALGQPGRPSVCENLVTWVAVLLVAISAFGQAPQPKFKVLRIADGYIIERRLDALGTAGYRVVALGLEGYVPVITLRLVPGHKYEYLVVKGGREFEQNLNKAGQSGYRIRRELILDNSGKSTALVERADSENRKFEYRIIKPQLPGKIPRLAAEALSQGFSKVGPFSYGAVWEREVGAPATPERGNVEGKLILGVTDYAKFAQRLSKEGREGYRLFTFKDIGVVMREKGEHRKFEYRCIGATMPGDFEQQLAAAQAQGFALIPPTFEATEKYFVAFAENSGEPVKQPKYTLEKRIDGVLADTNPAEIAGAVTRKDGLWYLLADAAGRSQGHLTPSTVAPENARRIPLSDKMEVAFDESNLYVSTAYSSWAIPRETIVEAIYMRGTLIIERPGFTTPIIAGGPSPSGGLITLGSLIAKGATSGMKSKSEEYMEVVVNNGESEYALTLKPGAKDLPTLKTEMTNFLGPRFTEMLNK